MSPSGQLAPGGPRVPRRLRQISQRLSPRSRRLLCFSWCFFSSRRRHTRCLSDWSSDVCSSDLYFYLYYLGQDRGARQKIGLARSRDGVRWEKLRSNPVLEADGNVGEPAVWQSHGFYWMLYTARLADETRHLRLARSTDGVRWTKLAAEFRGAQAWDTKV